MSLLLALLISFAAAADWVSTVDTIFHPVALVPRSGEVIASNGEELRFMTSEGAIRRGLRYDDAGRILQLERMSAAREGFVLSGCLGGSGTFPPVVVRLANDGTVRWARTLDVRSMDRHNFAVETSDGDIVVASRYADGMAVVRLTPSGALRSARAFNRTDWDRVNGLIAAGDGVLVFGSARSRFGFATRLRADGEVLWDRVLGTTDAGTSFYAAAALPDGGFVLAGRMRNYAANDRNGVLLRLSAGGEVLWQTSIGGDGEDGLFAVTRTADGGIAAAGGTASTERGDHDLWIVFAKDDGTIVRELAIGTKENDGASEVIPAAIAAAADGDLLFAGPGRLLTVFGKLSGAAPACDLVRPHQSATVKTAFVHFPGALNVQPFTPVVAAHAVTAAGAAMAAKVSCRWERGTASARTAARTAPAAESEEEAFAREVARLLLDGKFAALDTLAAELRAQKARFEAGTSKLRALYNALATHASLAALGQERHRGLLEAWDRATSSAAARIATAAFHHEMAWRLRGSGFTDSIIREDAEVFRELEHRALTFLAAADQSGACDASCYELMIRVENLGGWSPPLRKILEIDPGYWEAFVSATPFLSENWGGKKGAIPEFAASAADATARELGDAVYARILLHAGDWARARKGFRDFQQRYPKSAHNAHLFAHAAYAAGDRETARALFATPQLAWRTGVWRDRLQYERARTWAFAAPVEVFAAELEGAAGRAVPARWPKLVARMHLTLGDGRVDRTHAFLVQTKEGAVGVTTQRSVQFEQPYPATPPAITSWMLDLGGRRVEVPLAGVKPHRESWARFVPPVEATKHLHPLQASSVPTEIGDRVFIITPEKVIAARVDGASVGFGGFSMVPLSGPVDWVSLAGAPVLDQLGAMAGVVSPSNAAPALTGGSAAAVQTFIDELKK